MNQSKTTDGVTLLTVVDRDTFHTELDAFQLREKAHTREGDAIAAARRRQLAVEVDATLELPEPDGPLTLLDAFEGRRQLIAYYFMWNPDRSAPEQCEGCTLVHDDGWQQAHPPRRQLRGGNEMSMAEHKDDYGLFDPLRLGGSPVLIKLIVVHAVELGECMVAAGGEIVVTIEERHDRGAYSRSVRPSVGAESGKLMRAPLLICAAP